MGRVHWNVWIGLKTCSCIKIIRPHKYHKRRRDFSEFFTVFVKFFKIGIQLFRIANKQAVEIGDEPPGELIGITINQTGAYK